MNRENVESVLRSLRRVNIQGSFLGQTVAIRFGLSESDIETLLELVDSGAASAGRLSEITGLTSGAVTRVIDRLERAGYVRRVPDPADRRRVIVEVVPEKIAAIRSTLDRVSRAGADQLARYTDAQLAVIADFLAKMEDVTKTETATLRETPVGSDADPGSWEHAAPVGGLTEARLVIRSGLTSLRLRPGRNPGELYRASFQGSTPQVRLRDGRVMVQFKGLGWDWRDRSATIGLHSGIPWKIDLVGGIQHLEADLRDVTLGSLNLTGGAERVQLELGRFDGETTIRLVGGVKALRLERPAGVPVRLTATGGTAAVLVDGAAMGARGGETTLTPPGWDKAADRVDLVVVGGSKSIDIVQRQA